MWNKITSLMLALSILLMPLTVLAETPVPTGGKITGLRYGQKAPYSGVLLNGTAAAKLLTDKSFSEEQWKLKLEYELAKQSIELNLIIDSQKASIEALQNKHTTLLKIKDKEIERLSEIASNTNDYSVWWATGGVVAGIALTIAVIYAVQPGLK